MKDKKVPQPVSVVNLRDVTVYELLQMIERGEKNAYYMLLSLKAAEARMLAEHRPKGVQHSRD